MNEWNRRGCYWNSEKGVTSVESTHSFTEAMGWELAQDLERQKEKGKAFQGRVGWGHEQCDNKGRGRHKCKPV